MSISRLFYVCSEEKIELRNGWKIFSFDWLREKVLDKEIDWFGIGLLSYFFVTEKLYILSALRFDLEEFLFLLLLLFLNKKVDDICWRMYQHWIFRRI
jgi:hypothetical protein